MDSGLNYLFFFSSKTDPTICRWKWIQASYIKVHAGESCVEQSFWTLSNQKVAILVECVIFWRKHSLISSNKRSSTSRNNKHFCAFNVNSSWPASWKTVLISLVTHIFVANPSISLIGPGGDLQNCVMQRWVKSYPTMYTPHLTAIISYTVSKYAQKIPWWTSWAAGDPLHCTLPYPQLLSQFWTKYQAYCHPSFANEWRWWSREMFHSTRRAFMVSYFRRSN